MTGRRSRTAVRIGIAALVVVSASLTLSPLSSAAPSKQDVERAKAELDRLDQRVSLVVEQYNQARLQLQVVQGRLNEAKAAADRALATADRATESLNRNAAIAYQGVGSQFAALLEADSIADFSDRLEFIGTMAQADADLANEAEQARQEAQWRAEDLRSAVAERQKVLGDIRAKQTEVRAAVSDARAYYEELSRKYRQHIAALEAAQAAAAAAAANTGTISVGYVPGPPPAPNPNAGAAIQAAYSAIGTPYVFGAADPNVGFDCSGLTMWSWGQAGVSLPHSSAAQYAALPHVDRSDLQPGDLLFFFSPISHVAMYLTPSTMIDANHPGDVVNVRPIYWQYFVGAARP